MSAVRNYAIVTASYWGFTLTDGALRTLVLLHFYSLGYTPFTLAFLFLLYEAAGIFANLGGGWLATRFGIPRMLMTGLTLADHWLAVPLGPRTHLECRLLRSRGWSPRKEFRGGERYHQDGLKIRDQGNVGRWLGPVVPVGRLVHRVQECYERCGLFLRWPALGNPRLPGRLVAHGWRACGAFSSV